MQAHTHNDDRLRMIMASTINTSLRIMSGFSNDTLSVAFTRNAALLEYVNMQSDINPQWREHSVEILFPTFDVVVAAPAHPFL